MAKVILLSEDVEDGALPGVCVRCGRPAAGTRARTFSWGPEWVMLLVVIGAFVSGGLVLIALLIAPFVLWRRRVALPVCERHPNPWRLADLALYGGFGVFGVLVAVGVVIYLLDDGSGARGQLAFGLLCAAGVWVVLAIAAAAVLQSTAIRAARITPDDITLTGVHRDFADAYREERRRDRY